MLIFYSVCYAFVFFANGPLGHLVAAGICSNTRTIHQNSGSSYFIEYCQSDDLHTFMWCSNTPPGRLEVEIREELARWDLGGDLIEFY